MTDYPFEALSHDSWSPNRWLPEDLLDRTPDAHDALFAPVMTARLAVAVRYETNRWGEA